MHGREKKLTKDRKGSTSPQVDAGISPYHSQENLAAYDDDTGDAVTQLSDRNSGKRCAAVDKLNYFLQRAVVTDPMINERSAICAHVARYVTYDPKFSVDECTSAITLGATLCLGLGDDFPSTFEAVAAPLIRLVKDAVSTATRSSEFSEDEAVSWAPAVVLALDALALIHACDPGLVVGAEGGESIGDALAELVADVLSGDHDGSVTAALLIAACLTVSESVLCDIVAPVVEEALDSEDYDVVVAAVECVGIIMEKTLERERRPFAARHVERLARTSTKESGRIHKRALLPLVRAVVAFDAESETPTESIELRDGTFVVEGFSMLSLLGALRDVCVQGTTHQLASSPTAKRLFNVEVHLSETRKSGRVVAPHVHLARIESEADREAGRRKDRRSKADLQTADE